MLMKKLTVQLPRGLQARHTAIFVRKASSFKSEIMLSKNGKTANGKDLMEIMDLVIKEGDEVTLMVNGGDEWEANRILEEFLLNSNSQTPMHRS
ncbi:HPr family phosphocarrier protein [Priestia endophytica]|jgi:catabolite repression HPr-like protein/phosphocarrier protein|uniref:HPr family phosphocarrier protein n=2 Tax=Priestia endophytica TaxID=135735 RepID=A0AAX1Q5S5_9BACI|nr:HPr family phosphocarrier protein [Priestia endophytica]KAB2495522.1 HPr family phosphocarrier protein [Priestia endophytica]KYG27837.1 aldolase [Priestia endophytica]MCM3537419.1 HPr family phosphocarrier protein [Priestia endophytica]RAS73300.1 HPr family phosphocarrier protein [Priestia endophytica]RAS90467.1 HPr family phosphocarrier protein [Priestia endophytica]